jgi:3-oxoacyl-[acyl-carrier protein] reductase
MQGEWALITGASQGIGRATATKLAQNGVNLILHYHHHAEECMALAEELQRDYHVEVLTAFGDFARHDDVVKVGEEAIRHAPLTMVVNNAGSLIHRYRWSEMPLEYWDQCLALNLSSIYWLLRVLVPHLADGARIVNVSSVAADSGGGPGAFAYAAAKAGVNALTKGLAKELAPRNIRVNAVAPGTIDTGYHQQFSTLEGIQRTIAEHIPLKRLGLADECAELIVFLLSPRSSFVTGAVYLIDGGQSLTF